MTRIDRSQTLKHRHIFEELQILDPPERLRGNSSHQQAVCNSTLKQATCGVDECNPWPSVKRGRKDCIARLPLVYKSPSVIGPLYTDRNDIKDVEGSDGGGNDPMTSRFLAYCSKMKQRHLNARYRGRETKKLTIDVQSGGIYRSIYP